MTKHFDPCAAPPTELPAAPRCVDFRDSGTLPQDLLDPNGRFVYFYFKNPSIPALEHWPICVTAPHGSWYVCGDDPQPCYFVYFWSYQRTTRAICEVMTVEDTEVGHRCRVLPSLTEGDVCFRRLTPPDPRTEPPAAVGSASWGRLDLCPDPFHLGPIEDAGGV